MDLRHRQEAGRLISNFGGNPISQALGLYSRQKVHQKGIPCKLF
jgi:hypothetical protein